MNESVGTARIVVGGSWPVWLGLALGALGFALGSIANPAALLPLWPASSWYGAGAVALAALAAALLQGAARRPIPVALAIGSALVIATFGLGAFAAVALVLVSSYALGARLLQWSESAASSAPADLCLRTTVGLAVDALLFGLSSHWPINVPAACVAWAAFGIWLGRAHVFAVWRELANATRMSRSGETPFALRAILWFAFGTHVLFAALPERYHDALAMHLVVARAMELTGSWHYDARDYAWAVQPMGANWLLNWAYLMSGEYGAKLLDAVFVLLTSGVLLESRILPRGPTFLAIAIVVLTPVAFIVTATLFVDTALALFVVAMIAFATRMRDEAHGALVAGVALAAAGAIAVKLHGLIAVAALCAALLVVGGWRDVFRGGARMRVVWLLAAAGAAWPYLYAWYATGNPVFPYFNGVFKSPLYRIENFESLHFPGGLSASDFYGLTFFSARYLEGSDGALGFALTLLLPAGLLLAACAGSPKIRVVAMVSLLYTLVVLVNTRYLRYLFPVLPLFALLMVYPLTNLRESRVRTAYLAVAAVALFFGVLRIPAAGWILAQYDPVNAFSAAAKEHLIETQVPLRRIGRVESALGTNDSRVVVFGQPIGADIKGRPIYVNWYYYRLEERVLDKTTPEQAASTLAAVDASYVIFDRRNRMPEWAPWEAAAKRYGRLVASDESGDLYAFHADAVPGDSLFPDDPESWHGWTIDPAPTRPQAGDTLVLAPGAYVSRPVEVSAVPEGSRVTLTAEHACATPSTIRVQINWLRPDGSILRTDAIPSPCGETSTRGSVQAARPREAKTAYFYFANDGQGDAHLTDPRASALIRP